MCKDSNKKFSTNVNFCDGAQSKGLNVRFTKSCDNDCLFCIDKLGAKDLGEKSTSEMVESTLKSGRKEILILGGEPMLRLQRVKDYIVGIRKHVEKIYITTSLPWNMQQDVELTSEVMELIDCLNVSLQSTDNQENNKALRASNKYDRIEFLQTLIQKYPNKIRINLNLISGFIDTADKLREALGFLNKIGCTDVKIVEMQDATPFYVSFEKIMNVKFPSAYSYGCHQDISAHFPLKGTKVLLKRSCFVMSEKVKAKPIDLFKVLLKFFKRVKVENPIVYENACVYNGWL
ncbi:MAG: radical SAM protein [Candidatus Riflebacteria bacterium]|nr:radical SAM protein [Candidatus Riflebacteria bacterium]